MLLITQEIGMEKSLTIFTLETILSCLKNEVIDTLLSKLRIFNHFYSL